MESSDRVRAACRQQDYTEREVFDIDTGFDWPADLSTLGYLVTGDSSFGGGALRYFDETGLTGDRVLAFGEHQIGRSRGLAIFIPHIGMSKYLAFSAAID